MFKAGGKSRSVPLDGANACPIPWEVLAKPDVPLLAGVYGTRGGEAVLPTVWAGLGTILEGVTAGEDAQPPTPDLWERKLAGKQDRLTGLPGQVVGFDGAGNAVARDNAGVTMDEVNAAIRAAVGEAIEEGY